MSASPYGLSIVLDFEDNATEGMKSAANAFSGLSGSITNLQAGLGGTSDSLLDLNTSVVGMSVMGSALQNMGSGLLGTLKSVGESVIETSSSFENFDITLQALYKSEEAASKVTSDLFKYAAKSPFQVESLQGMVVTLKSQGLEAFGELQGAQTGLRQSTMDWIGDLQAFRPGETALKWKRAIQNFLSGTNNKSAEMLRNILDVGKLDDYLGHELGTSVEERMQDLIEIVEKTGMAGMQNRMSRTWSVTIANMEDTWSQFAYRIGFGNKENSMYKSATNSARNLLLGMTEVLGNKEVIKATSDAFLSLVSPIERVTEAIAMAGPALGKFLGNNPKIVKMATGLTAVGGAAIWATGSLLKMSAGALNWLLNVQRLGGLSGIFNMLSNAINMLSLRLVGIGAVGGLVYAAWKGNFLGLRTLVTKFTGQFGAIFKKTYKDMFPENGGEGISFFQSLENQGLGRFIKGLKTLKVVAQEAGESLRSGIYEFFKFFGLNLPSINAETFNLKNTLNELGDTIIEKFGGNAEKFKEKWGGVISTVGKVTGAFGSAIGVVTLLGGAIKLLSGAGGILATNLGIIASTLVSPAGLLGMGLTGLILGYQNNFLGLQNTVTPIVTSFQNKMKQLQDSFGQKNAEGKNTIFDTIKNKMAELNKASKTWRTREIIADYPFKNLDGDEVLNVPNVLSSGVSVGEILAQGIASGLIAFGGPIQKALGVTMWAFATDIGGIREGASSMVDQLINAKDLLLEMSTGYGPKSKKLAEQFGLTEFAEGITKLKRTSMSFLKSFVTGFAESNTIIGDMVKNLFPDLDFSVNGILNAIGRLGSKVSEKLGLDDTGNIASNYAQIAEKLGEIASKAMLIAPAFGALKAAMNFGVNPLALAGINQSLGLIGSGFMTSFGGILSGGSSIAKGFSFNLKESKRAIIAGLYDTIRSTRGVFSGFKEQSRFFVNGFTSSFVNGLTRAKYSWLNFASSFSSAGKNFMLSSSLFRQAAVRNLTGMKNAFTNVFKTSYAGSLTGRFKNMFHSWGQSITSLKGKFATFRGFVKPTGATLKSFISAMGNSLGIFRSFGHGLTSMFRATNLTSEQLGILGQITDDSARRVARHSMIIENMQRNAQVFHDIGMSFARGASQIGGAIIKLRLGFALQAITSGVTMFGSALAGSIKMVLGFAGALTGLAAISSLALAFGTLTTSDWQELNGVLKSQNTILGKLGAGWDWFNQKLAGVTSRVTEFIEKFDVANLTSRVLSFAGTLGDSLSAIVYGSNGSNGLADLTGNIIDQIIRGIANGSSRLGSNIGKILLASVNSITTYAPSIGNSLGNVIGKAFEWAGHNSGRIFNAAFTIMESFMKGLTANKTQIINGAMNIVDSFCSNLKTHAPQIIGAAGELIGGFINGIYERRESIGEAVQSVVAPIADILLSNQGKLVAVGKSVFGAMMDTIKAVVFEAVDDIVAKLAIFTSIFGGIELAVGLLSKNPFMAFKGGATLAGGLALGAGAIAIDKWGDSASSKLSQYGAQAETARRQTEGLNKALGEFSGREVSFKMTTDGSYEEVDSQLSQLELKTLHANNEIVYKTRVEEDGSTTLQAYEAKASKDSNGNIVYTLVAKEDESSSGKKLVDENVDYAKNNPMTQKLNVDTGENGDNNKAYEITNRGDISWDREKLSQLPPSDRAVQEEDAKMEQDRFKAIKEHHKNWLKENKDFDKQMRNLKSGAAVTLSDKEDNFFEKYYDWKSFAEGHRRVATEGKELVSKFGSEITKAQSEQLSSLFGGGIMDSQASALINNIRKAYTDKIKNTDWTPSPELQTKMSQLFNFGDVIKEAINNSGSVDEVISNVQSKLKGLSDLYTELTGEQIEFEVRYKEDGSVELITKHIQTLKNEDGTTVTVNEETNKTTNEETNKTTNEETNKTTNEETNTTVNAETNTTTNEVVNEETNTTKNETTNETKNEETNKTVNFSTSGEGQVEQTTNNLTKTETKKIDVQLNQPDWEAFKAGLGPRRLQITPEINWGLFNSNGSGISKTLNSTVNYTVGKKPSSADLVVESTVNYTAGTKPTAEDLALEASVKFNIGSSPETVPDAKGIANFKLGTSPKTVPDASGIANYSLGSYPTTVPDVTGTVNYVIGSVEKPSALTRKVGFGGNFAEGGIIPDSDFQIMNEVGGEIVDLPEGSRVYPHDESLNMSYQDGMRDTMKATKQLINSSVKDSGNGDSVTTVEKSSDTYDYSVNFSSGSIVVRVDNAKGDTDYEGMAQKVYDKIQTRLRRDKMARRG